MFTLVAGLVLALLPGFSSAPASTGTVVVARDSTVNVGTSTVTVREGTTVRQVLARLVASDRSRQSRQIVDSTGIPKTSGPVDADDLLTVLAEDGRSAGRYRIAIRDPKARERDGVYWNQPLYERIDRTVNANVPVFPNRRCDYRDSTFHTSNTLEASFTRTRNIKNFVVDNVNYIDPATGAITHYNTTPLTLLDETTADTVPLTTATIERPDVITTVNSETFTLAGKVDLTAHPRFPENGTIRIFVDRATTPIPVTLHEDGSFTSSPITLDDNQHWYRDRHYVAINFYEGININTMVYQVR